MKNQRTGRSRRREGWYWWIEVRDFGVKSIVVVRDWWMRWKDQRFRRETWRMLSRNLTNRTITRRTSFSFGWKRQWDCK